MVAYIDDFKLMMVIAFLVAPLLLLLRKPRVRTFCWPGRYRMTVSVLATAVDCLSKEECMPRRFRS